MMTTAAEPGRFGAAFARLGVERAWSRTRGSPDVLIAIVDEGGAAGPHSDAESFSAVAPGCRVLPVRFAARAGAQALDLAQAIEYAVEMGACIINVAHAADRSLPCVHRAIQYAATRNVLVICSAGADAAPTADDDDTPNVIRVMSVDEDGRPLANYTAAHLAAPGFARVPHGRGGHANPLDASIAAPCVSGCAALVKSLNPGWGYHELKEHLVASGTPQPHLTEQCPNGQMLNVAHAVLGPLEHSEGSHPLIWSSLNDAVLRWRMRYRSALCVNAVALFRSHADDHWRELAFARASTQKMDVPAASLRRSSGILRLACRESNFHSDDIQLTIR